MRPTEMAGIVSLARKRHKKSQTLTSQTIVVRAIMIGLRTSQGISGLDNLIFLKVSEALRYTNPFTGKAYQDYLNSVRRLGLINSG